MKDETHRLNSDPSKSATSAVSSDQLPNSKKIYVSGKIHSDIERGFIRAEAIRIEDLLEFKSEARCREHGKLRSEGKEYIVQDGDVIHFRFNV